MTEQQAIIALQENNSEALAFIVEKYQQKVYNTCLGLVQNENDAEELTQDVFIKVYKNSSSFKGEAQLSTWIYRIAVNESLQHLRKQKQRKWFFSWGLHSNSSEAAVIDFVHPGVLVEQKENAKLLFAVLKKIPEKQQIAFTLKNIEQLKQSEIAAIMQLSEGAVESLLQRAKENLKKRLIV